MLDDQFNSTICDEIEVCSLFTSCSECLETKPNGCLWCAKDKSCFPYHDDVVYYPYDTCETISYLGTCEGEVFF